MRLPGGASASIDARGLTAAQAARLLREHGPNELQRRGGVRWPRQLARQIVHPLALLLWAATGLAWIAGTPVLAAAIAVVVIVNALFAFVQERQAERAIEALSEYLPDRAEVIRDGLRVRVNVREIVPGDLLVVTEGERGLLGVGFAPAKVVATVSADAVAADAVDESQLAAETRDLVTRIVDGIGVTGRIDVDESDEAINGFLGFRERTFFELDEGERVAVNVAPQVKF